MTKFTVLKRIFWVLGCFLILSACAPPKYSKEDLTRLEAKEVQGIITEQSRGSFILKNELGEEVTYRTGQLTQYIPQNYRSQQEDKVRVSFQEIWERSGRAKLAVLQLEALEIPEKNGQLPNPIEGEIVIVDRGSSRYVKLLLLKRPEEEDARPIYVDRNAKIEVDGDSKTVDAGGFRFEDIVGKKVQITANREPIIRGNAYVYVAKHIVVK